MMCMKSELHSFTVSKNQMVFIILKAINDLITIMLNVFSLLGRFGQTTPPLVDFLKDILRRYPEGGQILKVGQGCMHVHLHAGNHEMRQINRKSCSCLHFNALSRFEWLYLFPSAPAMHVLNRTAWDAVGMNVWGFRGKGAPVCWSQAVLLY